MPYAGGRKDDQIRAGKKLSDVGGVVIYADGVYVCTYPDLFMQAGFEDYSSLLPHFQHFDLKLVGEFDLQSSRNSISGDARGVLKDQNFLIHVKTILDNFRTRHDGKNAFEHLVRRAKDQHYADRQTEAQR